MLRQYKLEYILFEKKMSDKNTPLPRSNMILTNFIFSSIASFISRRDRLRYVCEHRQESHPFFALKPAYLISLQHFSFQNHIFPTVHVCHVMQCLHAKLTAELAQPICLIVCHFCMSCWTWMFHQSSVYIYACYTIVIRLLRFSWIKFSYALV